MSPLLQRKEDEGARGVPLLHVVLAVVPLSPPFSSSSPAPPSESDPDPSLPLKGEEEARAPLSPPPPPPPPRKKYEGPRGVYLLCVVLAAVPFVSPILPLLSYSPCYLTHPLRPEECKYCFIFPCGLIVVSLRSARPPAFLRVSSAVPLRRWPKFRRIPGLLLREVDCYVTHIIWEK